MKITLLEVAEAYGAMVAIKDGNDMPILIAWAMGEWLAELAPVHERFNEQRNDLLKKYGKATPDKPNEFLIAPAQLGKFTPELDKLNAVEVEVAGQPKLKIAELHECGVKVPPGVSLKAMQLFIEH